MAAVGLTGRAENEGTEYKALLHRQQRCPVEEDGRLVNLERGLRVAYKEEQRNSQRGNYPVDAKLLRHSVSRNTENGAGERDDEGHPAH